MMKLIQEHIYIIYKRELSITKMFEKLYLGNIQKQLKIKKTITFCNWGTKHF